MGPKIRKRQDWTDISDKRRQSQSKRVAVGSRCDGPSWKRRFGSRRQPENEERNIQKASCKIVTVSCRDKI